jgi:DNA-3-methyladenine glycosylase II
MEHEVCMATTACLVGVTQPYRLDLTVSVLRRLSTNTVDILAADGHYLRVLGGVQPPVVVRVAQERPDALAVTIEGKASDHDRALAVVRRVLGTDREVTYFDRAAKRIPWLRQLAAAMRGVKPPRYPTLWEACVNAVVFQQVSLVAASAILRRMISAMCVPVERHGVVLYAFPNAETFLGTGDDLLRAAGLSTNKSSTLRRLAKAIESGALDEASLENLPSPEASDRLRRIKGIGPWTATLILLRGLGRLDVFPMNDSSVLRNLAYVEGPTHLDIDEVLDALGAQRGMLYYLLLARLELRGDLGRASAVPAA